MSAGQAALRFSTRIKELRIHMCQTSAASQGVRDFVKNHYVPIKKENPHFPILIRESSGVAPRVWARYEFGKESSVSLENKSASQVLSTIKELNHEASGLH